MARNLRYLRACLRDCLKRDESPYASHGLYTQPGVLDDGNEDDRRDGIQAGFQWRGVADATVVYTDLGTSTGMKYGIKAATQLVEESTHHRIEFRVLGDGWEQRAIECEQSFAAKWPDVTLDAYAKFSHDEALQLLEAFCDAIGFVVPPTEKFTRRDFIEGALREMVGAQPASKA